VRFDLLPVMHAHLSYRADQSQKQAALDKSQTELADLERRIAESKQGIIKESKGREDTVSL
jgi:hypothetical protein